MVLLQLLPKEDVASLSPRELEVLDSMMEAEIINSDEIKKILRDKVSDTMKALKSVR